MSSLPPDLFVPRHALAGHNLPRNKEAHRPLIIRRMVDIQIQSRIVAFLKRVEQEDYYDRNTDFTPFSLAA